MSNYNRENKMGTGTAGSEAGEIELSEEALEEVAGGLNPQPEPPGRSKGLIQSNQGNLQENSHLNLNGKQITDGTSKNYLIGLL